MCKNEYNSAHGKTEDKNDKKGQLKVFKTLIFCYLNHVVI